MKKILFILLLLPFFAFAQPRGTHRVIITDSIKALTGGVVDFKDTSRFEKMVSIGGLLDTSAILTLTDTAKGFLIPRMTTLQRDSIGSPATGLLIYNTTTNQIEFFETVWKTIAEGAFVKITGDTMTGDLTTANEVVIKAQNGGGELNLRYFSSNNDILLSTDNSSFLKSGLYLTNNNVELFAQETGAILEIYSKDKIGFGLISIGGLLAIEIQIEDNSSSNITSVGTDKSATFISSKSSTINQNVINSVVIGGVNITATENNTVYVPNLNIQDGKIIIHNSLVIKRECSVVVDDGTIVLPDATTQSLLIWVDGDDEWAQCAIQTDGTVTILTSVGSVVNTDTDTNLAIFDSGTGATIRNRLGSSKTVCFETKYKL